MTNYNKNKGIISLVVLVSIGFFALSTALTISLSVFTGVLKNRDTISGELTFYTSEAAAKEGSYQYIIENPCDYGEPCSYTFPELINNASLVDISIRDESNDEDLEWPYLEIEGTAENKISLRKNIYTLTVFPEGLAFDYAIFSQSELTFKGTVNVTGDIFANENIGFQGNNNSEIDGDAFSTGEIDGEKNVTGNIITGVQPIPPPELDLQDYLDIAQEQGVVFALSSEAKDYINNQIIEDIVYVTDLNETKIPGTNTQFSGCLIVEGDLHLTGGTYTKTNNYPAIIVRGNLTINGGTTIYGTVYVMGETSFSGKDNTIIGSLISVGNVKTELAGGASIDFNTEFIPDWKNNFPGLEDPVSKERPRIIQWREE